MAAAGSTSIEGLEDGFVLDGWRVQPHANLLSSTHGRGSERIEPRSMQVLLLLAANPGRFVSKTELLDSVWADRCVTEDVIVQAIGSLRRALRDDPQNPRYIETRKGVGYRLLRPPRRNAGHRFVRLLVGGSITAAAAALLSLLIVFIEPGDRTGAAPVLAVLPFDSLSDDSRSRLVAEALTDALIVELASGGRFRVVSRTSVQPYRETNRSAGDIAAALGADLLIEGSVLTDGERLRITAQLIDARRDEHLWVRRYDRPLGDLLALQSQIAASVAGQLTGHEVVPPSPAAQLDAALLERWLEANYLLNRARPDDLAAAADLYEELLSAEPSFGPAHAGRARSLLGLFADLAAPPQVLGEARRHAERALELGVEPSMTEATLGQIALFADWDFQRAEYHYLQALKHNPSNSAARIKYAWLLVAAGRYAEAEAQMAEIALLDPSYYAGPGGARLLLASDRHAAAVDQLERLNRLEPASARLALWLAVAYTTVGQEDAAAGAWIRHLALGGAPADQVESLRVQLDQAGARSVFRQLLADELVRSVVDRACLHVALGEQEAAIELIREAIAARDPEVLYLNTRPALAALLDDPRLATLRRLRAHDSG